ncbi:MAG: hypothetical protein GXP62_14290 [Oligoflexia bacterium]|nr:hypothetical protein [Oligoflexia bacterium]
MTGLLLASLFAASALADPPAAAADPVPTQASKNAPDQPEPKASPEPPMLTPEERAAMENMDLLTEIDLLQDFEVVRYLDVLRMEEE